MLDDETDRETARVGRVGNPDMDATAIAVQPAKTGGNGNLPVAERVVVRAGEGTEQAEVMETLAGHLAGSLHLAVFGVHEDVLSCHSGFLKE